MKKFLLLVSAIAALFLAGSCQRMEINPMEEGGNLVNYTIQVPEEIATKAVADIDRLYFEVYRDADLDNLDAKPIYEGDTTLVSGQANLALEFVKDQSYTVLFWAQKKGDSTNKGASYNVEDLRKVSMVSPLTANDATMEVFAGSDHVVNCKSSVNGNVVLVRPVAQINIATSPDHLQVGVGTSLKNIELQEVSVTIPDGLWGTYNVATKGVSNEDVNYTYGLADVIEDKSINGYTQVAMTYVGFAPEAGATVKVGFTIVTSEGDVTHSVENVPVKANYRTNIVGNLITAANDYTISLDAAWGDDGKTMEIITEGLIKNINGDYEVSSAEGLAYAINNLFAAGGNFYILNSIDMTSVGYNPVTVPAGVSTNIVGAMPVVTRATAATPIVITGLDTALISIVNQGASVSFVNVHVASDNPFVQTNNGAVAFSGCANSQADSYEAPEELIGSGDGKVVNMAGLETVTDLKEAIEAGVKSFTLTSQLTNAKGTEVVLNLAGVTITGKDTATGSFGLINNAGKLTISGSGSITLSATNNREWNAYSSVISNTVGGELTLNEGVMIEHLGGTDMAYALDNLTNGKGTSAVATINGATLKSSYRAVRQFLNGVEATNELTVKSGSKLYGENKSIFFQDPSANPNTGKLVVEEGAELHGDVYLFVTENSTQWPVSVSIPSSTLTDGSKVTYKNVPEGYEVVEVNGVWKAQSTYDAQIDDTKYTDLADALDAAFSGQTIQFLRDIIITETVTMPAKDIVLNLNGNSIIITDIAPDYSLVCPENSKICFKTGKIISTESSLVSALYVGGGEVVLNDVEILTKHSSIQVYKNGKAILNNCNISMGFAGQTGHSLYTGTSGGAIEVNGGTYENTANDAGSTGSSVINGNITVNSGTFRGRIENYYGSPVIKGGSFSVRPSDSFIPDGYSVIQDGENYVVVKLTDLNSTGTANSYIVSEAGTYKFKTVKGNSTESVGSVASAEVLWESFGTATAPRVGDLIKSVSYSDGAITFETADTFCEGNAVIAAKDASGNILWSWHIWLTDAPEGQTYNNGHVVMDRNLGATSTTPGDVEAYGLLYQWGRKDPFLGSSSTTVNNEIVADSTIDWPTYVASSSETGTISYATANPTTFIGYESGKTQNNDWYYYSREDQRADTRWTSAKSIYDPCPEGWRVPDGGEEGTWTKALNAEATFATPCSYKGINMSGKFGSDANIWYPAGGMLYYQKGDLRTAAYMGYYWSVTPSDAKAYSMQMNGVGKAVDTSSINDRGFALSVRCVKQ